MFQFFKPPFKTDNSDAHVATLPTHIHNVKDLVAKVGAALGFPPHSGKNFDAFWDSVRDLPAQPKHIVLVHEDLPKLHKDDLETYLELLRDAGLYWEKHHGEHVLEIWFPEKCRKKIDAALKDVPMPEDEELE